MKGHLLNFIRFLPVKCINVHSKNSRNGEDEKCQGCPKMLQLLRNNDEMKPKFGEDKTMFFRNEKH